MQNLNQQSQTVFIFSADHYKHSAQFENRRDRKHFKTHQGASKNVELHHIKHLALTWKNRSDRKRFKTRFDAM